MRQQWRRSSRIGALIAGSVMLISSCSFFGSDGEPVMVTVTETPTQTQVTAPSGDAQQPTQEPTDTETADPTTVEPAVPQVRVSSDPAFESTDMGPLQPITITAFNAEFVDVIMTGDDGVEIAGDIIDDGHTWTRTGELEYGHTYTVTATAQGRDGNVEEFTGTYTTVDPEETMAAYMQIPDDTTVGIAAPIVLTFAGSVTDRMALKDRLHVTINDEEVEGAWVWMLDEDIQGTGVEQSRVHFRPKEYWPGNAEVHFEANLYGVNYGSGWGRSDIVRDFKIGPKLIVKAEVETHRLLVIQDDVIIRDYPVSYGIPADHDPGRTTVSGIHIVQEKKPGEFEMCNPKYNYCGSKQYWGVRINNNGEFIHVNKQTEASGLLGKANVSHGCVNMGMRDGEEFFNLVYYGVPVDVEGTGVEMGYSDYVWDWSRTWDEWRGLSASQGMV